jgi:cell wall-associated NlpC family hydrolase
MCRRWFLLGILALACAAGAAMPSPGRSATPTTAPPATWDPSEIATVVASGVLGPSVDGFRPADALTWGELSDALAAFGHPLPAPPDPTRTVTVRELDAQLVAALGLLPASRAVRLAAKNAGLEPIASLGTETVARLAGLRLNHLAPDDSLELLPTQPVTRAEAAYSFARALTLPDWQKQQILDETSALTFPELRYWQRVVLTRALRFVGFPYVWTGTSEKALQTLWDGTVVPGGFDCSGFVWRVYKLQPFPGTLQLSEVLQGRTTYAMSGEVPARLRIARAALEPADLVFFGERGAKSKPAEIAHVGIYLGSGWFVHSSEHGVTLDPITDWYETRFAWARRPLAEAGLDGAKGALPPVSAPVRSAG